MQTRLSFSAGKSGRGDMSKRSENALLARSVRSHIAEEVAAKHTLGELKQMQEHELQKLGLTDREIANIRSGSRPPIPAETLQRVLFANRSICCVCRSPNKPIVVHHIREWSKSRDHSEDNLCVICQDHHDKAHSKSDLTQNLDEKKLTSFKQQWEAKVKIQDSQLIRLAIEKDGATWSYVNLQHVYKNLDASNFNYSAYDDWKAAQLKGVIDSKGYLILADNNSFYAYEGQLILARNRYLNFLMRGYLRDLPLLNISDLLTPSECLPLIFSEQIVFLQGAFYFKSLSKEHKRPGQTVQGYRQVRGLRFEFTFDKWLATSSSAGACWLAGRQNAGTLLRIRTIVREGDTVRVLCTLLAASYGTESLKQREYWNGYQQRHFSPGSFEGDLDEFDEFELD